MDEIGGYVLRGGRDAGAVGVVWSIGAAIIWPAPCRSGCGCAIVLKGIKTYEVAAGIGDATDRAGICVRWHRVRLWVSRLGRKADQRLVGLVDGPTGLVPEADEALDAVVFF